MTRRRSAAQYGHHQAERRLGQALQDCNIAREDVVLASKFGMHEGEEQRQYRGEDIGAALRESLSALGTEYLDVYFVHWPGNMRSAAETVEALEAAQAAGLIKCYGVCNFGSKDLKGFLDAGGRPVANQFHYNLLWRSIEPEVIPACLAANCKVLCYSAVMQGMLSGDYSAPEQVPNGMRRTALFRGDSTPDSRHGGPGHEELMFGALEALRGVCERAGCSMIDAAIAWLLAQPAVGAVLVGAYTAEQVAANAKLPPTIAPSVLEECGRATGELKAAVGPVLDAWARESRIDR